MMIKGKDGRYYFILLNREDSYYSGHWNPETGCIEHSKRTKKLKGDSYYRGCWNPETKHFEFLKRTKKLRILYDYLKSNGCPVPEHIQEWTLESRPDDDRPFDYEERFINTHFLESE